MSSQNKSPLDEEDQKVAEALAVVRANPHNDLTLVASQVAKLLCAIPPGTSRMATRVALDMEIDRFIGFRDDPRIKDNLWIQFLDRPETENPHCCCPVCQFQGRLGIEFQITRDEFPHSRAECPLCGTKLEWTTNTKKS